MSRFTDNQVISIINLCKADLLSDNTTRNRDKYNMSTIKQYI